jgi:hypothetical protein
MHGAATGVRTCCELKRRAGTSRAPAKTTSAGSTKTSHTRSPPLHSWPPQIQEAVLGAACCCAMPFRPSFDVGMWACRERRHRRRGRRGRQCSPPEKCDRMQRRTRHYTISGGQLCRDSTGHMRPRPQDSTGHMRPHAAGAIAAELPKGSKKGRGGQGRAPHPAPVCSTIGAFVRIPGIPSK